MRVVCDLSIYNNATHPNTKINISANPDDGKASNFVRISINGVEYELSASQLTSAIKRCTSLL